MITDLHNDVLTVSLKKAKKVGESAKAVCAVWTTGLINPVQFLRRVKDLARYKAIEDLHFITDENLDILNDFAPVYASLTWNDENALAGGAHSGGSLTPLGRRVIKEMESRAVTLDTAHLNERSFYMATEITNQAFICSHTCFNGIYKHHRNLSDAQIRLIIQSGGLIGLTLVPEFMGMVRAGKHDVLRQIDYFCARFCCQKLAFGTDFFGTANPALRGYAELERLKNELIKAGYSSQQIDGIFYKNAMDFLSKHEKQF